MNSITPVANRPHIGERVRVVLPSGQTRPAIVADVLAESMVVDLCVYLESGDVEPGMPTRVSWSIVSHDGRARREYSWHRPQEET